MDRGLLENMLRVGVLEIQGIFIDKIPEEWIEGIEYYGCYEYIKVKVERSTAINWNCYKPLKEHISEYFKENEGEIELLIVFGTSNCAFNIGIPEVKAVINCLVDGCVKE